MARVTQVGWEIEPLEIICGPIGAIRMNFDFHMLWETNG